MNIYQILLITAGGFLLLTGLFGASAAMTGFDSPREKTHKVCLWLAILTNICMWLTLAGLAFVALGSITN